MKIGILGTGMVGTTIGSALVKTGYEVFIGAREANNEKASAFVQNHKDGKARHGKFSEAADFGEVVFNCTNGGHSLDALQMAVAQLDSKILIDVANPIEFSTGTLALIPSLSNLNSLGEAIQKEFPKTKVVKTFNTMWCGLMVNPALVAGGDHTNFICGNDAEAKQTALDILKDLGWRSEMVIDLGDITSSRGMEASLLLWFRIMNVFGNGSFNMKITR